RCGSVGSNRTEAVATPVSEMVRCSTRPLSRWLSSASIDGSFSNVDRDTTRNSAISSARIRITPPMPRGFLVRFWPSPGGSVGSLLVMILVGAPRSCARSAAGGPPVGSSESSLQGKDDLAGEVADELGAGAREVLADRIAEFRTVGDGAVDQQSTAAAIR